MDDLNATLSAILGDPQKMEQLRAVAQSLGMNPPAAEPAPQANPGQGGGGFDPAAMASLFQNLQGMAGGGQAASSANPPPASPPNGGSVGGLNFGAISKISEIMGVYNQSDKNVELLRSLKPHFALTRAGRIDDAVRIMQLMRAWPTLRDSGLLSGLGSLFGNGGDK